MSLIWQMTQSEAVQLNQLVEQIIFQKLFLPGNAIYQLLKIAERYPNFCIRSLKEIELFPKVLNY